MKINPKALAPLAVVAAFGLGTLAPHAQTAPQKIAFVDVQKVLAAHPNDKDIKAIQKQADTELAEYSKKIQVIDAKGAQATAAEKDQRAQLLTTAQAKAKAFDAQLQPKVQALETAVDKAMNTVAQQNGVSIVMDRGVAATSGLVVYAEQGTDLTESVLKAVK